MLRFLLVVAMTPIKRGGVKSLKEERGRGAFCFLAGSGRLDCD